MNTRMVVTSKGGSAVAPIHPNARCPTTQDHDDTGRLSRRNGRPLPAPTSADYERYKTWCDEYFYLPHRKEMRGIGGIFYDHLDERDWDAAFAFTQDVGRAFLDIYPELVRRHWARPGPRPNARSSSSVAVAMSNSICSTTAARTFGLKTGGNVDAILSSMPPLVMWP